MRLERLDLLRYGGLTDRSLAFRSGARLHLVYGANEAGKSTALAAIADLLFGFPHAKEWDFRHEAKSLRVGARLVNSHGEHLSFRRRRGNKNTLLSDDEAETPLRDDALVPFLGNLGRDVFLNSFGLNSARLRDGARALLSQEGDGQGALFAAASGRHGLAALRKALDEEASGLFAARASKDRRFFQALARHEEATKLMRERELREAAWKGLNAAVDAAEAALDEASVTLKEHRKRERRLDRLLRLRPLLEELLAHERALDRFADLAEVPDSLTGDLKAALDGLDAVEAIRRAALVRAEEAGKAHAALVVDDALLERAEEIAGLFAETGAYRQRLEQIPRVQAEADAHGEEIAAILRRLGHGGDDLSGAALNDRQPADADLAGLSGAIEAGRRIERDAQTLAESEAKERQALADLDGEAQPGVQQSDPGPLLARLAALAPDLKTLDGVDEIVPRLAATRRRLAEEAGRLDPPVADPDALATVPLPSLPLLSAHRDRLAGLGEEARRQEDALREMRNRIDRIAAVVAEAERGGDIPSAEAIRAARAARDHALAGLPDALAVARAGAGDPLADVQGRVAEADRLADRAIAEAERVTRHQANREALAGHRAELAALEAEGERVAGEREAAWGEWQAAFAGLGMVPLAPERMLDWCRGVEALLQRRGEAVELADRLQALEQLAETLRPDLEALARDLDLEIAPAERLRPLARRLEATLAKQQESWAAGRMRAARREDLCSRVERIVADRQALAARSADWRARFDAALAPLGLPAGSPIAAAEAAVAAWRELPAALARRDHAARRVEGMRRDNRAFEARVATLSAGIAPDLADHPPVAAAALLNRRHEEQLAARIRRDGALSEKEKAESGLEQADARLAEARARLEVLRARLPRGLAEEALRDLAVRLCERDGLALAHADSLSRFAQVSEGESRAAVAEELAGFDADSASVDLEGLQVEDERLTRARDEAHAARQAALADRRAAEEGEGAEKAAFIRQAAETEMLDVAREWSVLRISALLLDAALARHRQSQGDPLVERAGEIFAKLTDGAFSGLTRSFAEDDRSELCALRAEGGEEVAMSGLSEGTGDQLYLALRLAFLSDYASRAEAAPFIGDDLFQTFDDNRTAAGLRALAGLSESLQPILFTHHRSVVDIARSELGDGLDLVDL
ncbi:ATP-binding protein [Stappia sp. ICDLI1TA098]